jgi:hypothetical protein
MQIKLFMRHKCILYEMQVYSFHLALVPSDRNMWTEDFGLMGYYAA